MLRKHFLVCAVPMVGFGIMDNSIMIHAGDLIDSTVGLYLGLATLGAAACGQVVSDVCGVCCGGTVEALASKAGMTPPPLSLAQRNMRIVKLTGTAGAAVGVFFGCCIGMLNLLFLDLDKKEKLKRKKELETIFETVAETSDNLIGVERSSIWLLDHHEGGKGEGTEPFLWTVAATGIDQVIKVPIGPGAASSLVSQCAASKDLLNVVDCYADQRFNSDVDKATGFKTKNMLCVPVLDEEKQLHGVVQLINKKNGEAFNIEDERLCRMLATHVAVFVKHTGDE